VAQGKKGERILAKVRAGEVDVLVGTQMVTKGHDLPRVTLVGVLNADATLSLPDFRAAERCFHLLVQVAGRAGRGERPGRVLIQTRQPGHAAIALAVKHDVAGFIEHELEARRELSYPPFSHLALIRVDATREGEAMSQAARLAEVARANASHKVEVLGPAPAPLARLRNRYRYRFMLRAADRAALRRALLPVARCAVSPKVRVAIDIDPINML
jgi:primosomal protein N' (replication factor Y)